MLKKLNKYVQQRIATNYNKMDKRKNTFDDAAFLTFLTFLENFFYSIFVIFSIISFSLFTKYEILPFLGVWNEQK